MPPFASHHRIYFPDFIGRRDEVRHVAMLCLYEMSPSFSRRTDDVLTTKDIGSENMRGRKNT
jgi:hypothetical protein